MMYELFFDGACEPNPGLGSSAYVLQDSTGVVEQRGQVLLDRLSTNNEAEYFALYLGLQAALNHGVEKITVRGDSKLVVEQVNQRWRCKSPVMEKLRDQTLLQLARMEWWSLTWIGRDENQAADDLSKEALRQAGVTSRY